MLVNVLLMASAMLGDSTGYLLGRQTGPRIFSRPDSRLFKQEYVTRTKAFYERYGGKTIPSRASCPSCARSRLSSPAWAQMPYLRFLPFSVCGGVGWVFMLTMLGYELGGVPLVRHNFDKVILAIIFVSLLPTLTEVLKARREHKAGVATQRD